MTKLTAFIRQRLAKLVCDRTGSITVITAGYFIVVLGAAGLGTEVSYWYVKKRAMQGAADSAAFAAAASLLGGDTFASGNPTAAANAILARYGYTSSDATIAVNNPPLSGNYTASANAVEVIVTQSQPRLISALFMPSDPAITGRAVATQISTNPPSCVVTLDKTKVQPDLVTNGAGSANMPDCNVFINSGDPNGALDVSGTSDYTANATYMDGNYVKGSNATLTDNTGTYTNTGTSYPDPYAGVTPPTFSGCDHTNYKPPSGTLSPGVYCGGLTINNNVNVTLSPGTYIINGTGTSTNGNVFQINGGATVTGNGVTIVLTGSGSNYSTVQINGNSTVNLSAPPQGATAGIPGLAFFQDRNAPATPFGSNGDQFNGGANMNITGAVYFPNQLVTYTGGATTGAGGAKCTQIVSYQLTFSGTTNFNSSSANCAGTGIVSLSGAGGPASISLVE